MHRVIQFSAVLLVAVTGERCYLRTEEPSITAIQFVCGVNAQNEIFCTTDIANSSPNWHKLPGALKQLSMYGNEIYGVNAEDQIYYGTLKWENDKVEMAQDWIHLEGRLKSIHYDGKYVCGTNVDDDIYCANSAIKVQGRPNWNKLSGKLTQIVHNNGKAYGINKDNSIYRAYLTEQGGDVVMEGSWTMLSGKLKQLSYDGKTVCGCNDHDDVYCRNSNEGTWTKLPGQLKWVNVFGDKLHGVNKLDEIYTAKLNGLQIEDHTWSKHDGKLIQIAYQPQM